MTAKRLAALRVEVVEVIRVARRGFGCTGSLSRYGPAVRVMCADGCALEHLAFHLVDVFLCILNHLDGLFPFLLERRLRLFNFLLLHLHPTVNLLLLEREAAR